MIECIARDSRFRMSDMTFDNSTLACEPCTSHKLEIMDDKASECGDLRVGRIIAITPSQAIILLERRGAAGPTDGVVPLEMGTLVKLHSRASIVYGMVTGLRVPLPSLEPSDKDLRLVELELVGEIRHADGASGCFRRGVSGSPALDEPVYLASASDLAKVYARPHVPTARVGV